MKPIDYRNEAWDQVRERVAGLRLATYEALLRHGPCTTRDLARLCGIGILTVRPRVTELYQLGWVVLADESACKHEGAYRALSEAEARAAFERRRAEAIGVPVQGELPILV